MLKNVLYEQNYESKKLNFTLKRHSTNESRHRSEQGDRVWWFKTFGSTLLLWRRDSSLFTIVQRIVSFTPRNAPGGNFTIEKRQRHLSLLYRQKFTRRVARIKYS